MRRSLPAMGPERRLRAAPGNGHGGDQVRRLEAFLRANPGWRLRYDGMRDKFAASREGDDTEIARRELRDLLDALEGIRRGDGP